LDALAEIVPGVQELWRSGWAPAEIDRLKASSLLADRIAAIRYAFVMAPHSILEDLINELLESCPELSGGLAYVVSVDEGLYYRQDTATSLLAHETAEPGTAARIFRNAQASGGGSGLHSLNHFGAAVYLMPVTAVMCPAWIGFVVSCAGGSVVFVYPQAIRPIIPRPVSLSEVQRPWYFTTPAMRLGVPLFSQSDVEAYVEWWIDQWDRVLGQILDPWTHIDSNGFFDPYLMYGRRVTLERFLTTVLCILEESGSNDFVRMALFFDAIDLLDDLGARLGRRDRLLKPESVVRDLERVCVALSGLDPVAHMVLPRCEAGVEGLLALRGGFHGSDFAQLSVSQRDQRVFDLLQALRDAGHGLGRNRNSRPHLTTLMTHDAAVSPYLADLAWLHLTRLMISGRWRQGDSSSRLA
jgi:hypothetical protein